MDQITLWIGLGTSAIGLMIISSFLLGRVTAPKHKTKPDLFAEQPIQPRPVAELRATIQYERNRATLATMIIEGLSEQLGVVEAELKQVTQTKDRHWTALKNLRAKVSAEKSKPQRHLRAVS